MEYITSKSKLAITLSKLETFSNPKIREEQYPTDSEIAADLLWNASLQGDIKGKVIADLGAGTGILGIGCLLLGAKEVFFVEKDKEALKKSSYNLYKLESESSFKEKAVFCHEDIASFKKKVEVVVMNPPFGTKVRHHDKVFLKKAIEIAPIIYSFHKSSTRKFVEVFAEEHSYECTHVWGYQFPLKASHRFHRRRIQRIDVSCFRFKKINLADENKGSK